MKIVILGAGQVGGTLAEHLVQENYDVTLVDTNSSRLQQLQGQLDIQTIVGSASQPDVLIQSGIKHADMLIAVTNSDEVNMLGCFIAYELFRTPNKIARVRARSYHHFPKLFSDETIPVDVLISPESLITNHIEKLIQFPGANDILDFADGLLHLAMAQPKKNCQFIGKPLAELFKHVKHIDMRVQAIIRNEQVFEVNEESILEDDDILLFIASASHTHHALVALGHYEHPSQRIIVGGGGNIGKLLSAALDPNYKLKVIDHNYQNAQWLANHLQNATVLQGDIGDRDLLKNENIENTDCYIAVTNDDETNIMSCLLAEKLGAKHTMALINRQAYVELIQGSSIDHAISPQLTTIGSILAKLRKGDTVTVHSLGRIGEAIEVIIHGDYKTSKVVDKTLQEIKLPPKCKIMTIVRDGKVIMTKPDTRFQAEDHVILLVLNKRYIHQVEQLFQVKIDYI